MIKRERDGGERQKGEVERNSERERGERWGQ